MRINLFYFIKSSPAAPDSPPEGPTEILEQGCDEYLIFEHSKIS